VVEKPDHLNPPDGSFQSEQEIKRLATAGEMLQAVNLYRQIHNVGVKDAVDAIRQMAGLPPIPEKIGVVQLSAETTSRLEILFRPEDRAEVIRLLVEKCGDNLPWYEQATPESLDRPRFAALKLSEGNLSRLRDAVRLANIDWRDLLVAAGFANDPKAHEHWIPKTRSMPSSP
jgi:hypothetical protein